MKARLDSFLLFLYHTGGLSLKECGLKGDLSPISPKPTELEFTIKRALGQKLIECHNGWLIPTVKTKVYLVNL